LFEELVVFHALAFLGLFQSDLDAIHDSQMVHYGVVGHVILQSLHHSQDAIFPSHDVSLFAWFIAKPQGS
jgi:hypothetical protein